MHARLPWIATMIAVACLSMPGAAEAQIGGLIKKKVRETVKGSEPSKESGTPQGAAPSGPQFNERVLELNTETLDKVQAGLIAAKTYRDSVEAWYAKQKTPEQYQQCSIEAMTSPEVVKISEAMDPANRQAYMAAGQKVIAAVAKKCGPDPSTFHKSQDLGKASGRAAEAAGMTDEELAIALERIPPFCGGDGSAKIPGSGGLFYVYSESEIAALKPRCAKLMSLISDKPATTGRKMK